MKVMKHNCDFQLQLVELQYKPHVIFEPCTLCIPATCVQTVVLSSGSQIHEAVRGSLPTFASHLQVRAASDGIGWNEPVHSNDTLSFTKYGPPPLLEFKSAALV